MRFFISSLLGIFIAGHVQGHGRLVNPPSRASMWRFGFDNPPDYNDNEGFCGGFNVQWDQNEGRCGICGDNWADEIREHEAPNRYANGIIAAEYQSGQEIDVTVDLTANHFGHFTFKLCPAESLEEDPEQDCFDANVLTVLPDDEDRYNVTDSRTGDFVVKVQLPDIECDRCILQWTYTAGNNWGWCNDQYGDLGCGPQETFRACSDISIRRNLRAAPRPRPIRPNAVRPNTQQNINNLLPQGIKSPYSELIREKVAQSNEVPRRSVCRGVGAYARLPGIDAWCAQNCLRRNSYCPESHCKCF